MKQTMLTNSALQLFTQISYRHNISTKIEEDNYYSEGEVVRLTDYTDDPLYHLAEIRFYRNGGPNDLWDDRSVYAAMLNEPEYLIDLGIEEWEEGIYFLEGRTIPTFQYLRQFDLTVINIMSQLPEDDDKPIYNRPIDRTGAFANHQQLAKVFRNILNTTR